MTRTAWALVLSLAIGCVAAGNYLGAARIRAETGAPSSAVSGISSAEPLLHPAQADMDQTDAGNELNSGAAIDRAAAGPQLMGAEPLAKLSAAIDDVDADIRAAAINTLATVPKLQAIPILQKVLNSGFNQDRELAVNSLHTLAVEQGDAGGEIRNVLRLTTYDGEETIASSAQIALEQIEREAERMSPPLSR